MPTVEIISVGATSPPVPPRLTRFAQRHEQGVASDRGLFEYILKDFEGTIVHLGDPGNTEDPSWFCGHVIEFFDDDKILKFQETAIHELSTLMIVMVQASPTGHIIFLTDYQFGPTEIAVKHLGSIGELERHNSAGKLRFNTLYHIQKA